MEGPEDAQIMLSRAVECCPTSVEVKFLHGHRLSTAINVNINITRIDKLSWLTCTFRYKRDVFREKRDVFSEKQDLFHEKRDKG